MADRDDGPLRAWADHQRALARALGLTVEAWLAALDRAAERRTGVTAAVVGAAMAEGLGLGLLDRLDPPAVAARARALIDPRPPAVESPLLKEAVRRAAELTPGEGKKRLQRKKEPPPTPLRETGPERPSAGEATPDAPGGAR